MAEEANYRVIVTTWGGSPQSVTADETGDLSDAMIKIHEVAVELKGLYAIDNLPREISLQFPSERFPETE